MQLQNLYTNPPQDIRDLILNIKPRLVDGVQDRWIWDLDSSGLYSTKLAYRWLSNENVNGQNDRSWKWIWKLQIPANIQFFIWQLCHMALPTQAILPSRGILVNPTYSQCNAHAETIHHRFFSCGRSREVWQSCLQQQIQMPDEDFDPLI